MAAITKKQNTVTQKLILFLLLCILTFDLSPISCIQHSKPGFNVVNVTAEFRALNDHRENPSSSFIHHTLNKGIECCCSAFIPIAKDSKWIKSFDWRTTTEAPFFQLFLVLFGITFLFIPDKNNLQVTKSLFDLKTSLLFYH